MSVLDSVRDLLEASSRNADGGGEQQSKGAYWCHDCGERVPDFDVDGESPPECPSCGEPMTFERSPDSAGCAC